jgi:hypothetical protein
MELKQESYLHFNDLKLLMDNYQNVVRLNTILLEQQKQIVELQKELVLNQRSILKDQGCMCERIDKVIGKIDLCSDNFKQIENCNKLLDADLHARFNDTITKVDNIRDSIDDVKLDMVKQHSGISLKLYGALGSSIAVILGLLTFLISTYDKFKILDNISDMLHKIMVFLKVV